MNQQLAKTIAAISALEKPRVILGGQTELSRFADQLTRFFAPAVPVPVRTNSTHTRRPRSGSGR